MAKKHGFDYPIVVADAGLLSKANIDELQKNGYEYIIGVRVKNESDAVKQAVIDMDLQYGDVKVIDKGDGIRLVVSKSEKRAKKDAIATTISALRKANRQASNLKDDCKPVLHGERLMTDGELAAALRFGPRALRDYRNSGILPYIRLKGNIVYKESDIEKVLAKHYKRQIWHIKFYNIS